MTPLDLEAIKERGVGRLTALRAATGDIEDDVSALIAEVERLLADKAMALAALDTANGECARFRAEVERLAPMEEALWALVMDVEDYGSPRTHAAALRIARAALSDTKVDHHG
jgi:hypothetical protein